MKHLGVVIIGHSDAGCSTISSLYKKPVEVITDAITTERITSGELRDLSEVAEIQIIRSGQLFDFPFLEEREVTKWPKDRLLNKRRRPNTKGYSQKDLRDLGRR